MAEESTEKSGAHSASDPETENCQTVSRLLVKYPCRFFFAFLFVILGMTMIAGAADGVSVGMVGTSAGARDGESVATGACEGKLVGNEQVRTICAGPKAPPSGGNGKTRS